MRVAFLLAVFVSGCFGETDGATPDHGAPPCDACTADELCVVLYDGVCQGIPRCVARTVECPDNACTSACQTAYCGRDTPYQCASRPTCGDEPAGAFTCYGH